MQYQSRQVALKRGPSPALCAPKAKEKAARREPPNCTYYPMEIEKRYTHTVTKGSVPFDSTNVVVTILMFSGMERPPREYIVRCVFERAIRIRWSKRTDLPSGTAEPARNSSYHPAEVHSQIAAMRFLGKYLL